VCWEAFKHRKPEIDLNTSVSSLKLLAQQVITMGLDLIFPPLCVNCDRVGSFLCPQCVAASRRAAERSIPGLDGVQVWGDFEGAVRAAVHAFKYEGRTRLAGPLGALVVDGLATADWRTDIDVVTAVPLHASRLHERGYNQAALLAQVVAVARGWLFAPAAVHRIRQTASQVNLNAQERHLNVEAAFSAEPSVVDGMRVLVIDDVLTTGSTLLACADALRDAGAARVYGATVAGAVGFRDQ
jgi:ComF family protein